MRIGIDARKLGDFGIGTYVAGLLDGLASLDAAGDEFVVFTRPAWRERIPDAFTVVTVDIPNYSVREMIGMARAISRARLDLFHTAHFALPLTRCPSIATIHDLIPRHFPYRNPVARLYFNAMIARAVRKSIRLVTVSEASRRQIASETLCPIEKIAVTPNGIDPLFFEQHDSESRYGRYFLFVGNDKPHKNVDALIEAFAQLRRSDSSLQLVLAGARFDRFRGQEGLQLTGFVSVQQLASLYRGALAVVVPSLEEGFGLPALEAMASGVPVITSRAAALVEVTGEAALHVEVRDPNALAAAMQRVAGDADLCRTLADAGRERSRRFTWRHCAELTREVYRDALREASSTR